MSGGVTNPWYFPEGLIALVKLGDSWSRPEYYSGYLPSRFVRRSHICDSGPHAAELGMVQKEQGHVPHKGFAVAIFDCIHDK